ncbi:hypothetical protein GOODEAATRI_007821, partial [Goodea atripinnis]
SEECRQRESVAVLLEERLQRERSWVRKLEGDLRRAASVLTAIATDPKKIPGAQVKMHKLLQVLDTSELQERGSSLSESSGRISGELKPQTPEVEAASFTINWVTTQNQGLTVHNLLNKAKNDSSSCLQHRHGEHLQGSSVPDGQTQTRGPLACSWTHMGAQRCCSVPQQPGAWKKVALSLAVSSHQVFPSGSGNVSPVISVINI